jgi:hypothetical protein
MSIIQKSVNGLFKDLPHVFDLETYNLPRGWLENFGSASIGFEQLPQNLEAEPLKPPTEQSTLPPSEVKLPSGIADLPRVVPDDRDLPLWPPIGACGFYLPFHYSISNWGVYLIESKVAKLAEGIQIRAPKASYYHCYIAATAFTYYHEAYHHKIEMLATRMELFSQKPVYIKDFEKYYQESFKRNEPNEETAANVHAILQVRRLLKRIKTPGISINKIDEALLFYVSKSPKHYSLATQFFRPYTELKTEIKEWKPIEHRFFDNLARAHFGGKKLSNSTWDWGTALLTPRNKANGKMTFIWPKGSTPHRLTTLSN